MDNKTKKTVNGTRDKGLPVVSGDHIGGHHERGSGRSCEAKVEDLEGAIGPHYNVARLQISGQGETVNTTFLHIGDNILEEEE